MQTLRWPSGTSHSKSMASSFLVTQIMGYLTGGPQRYTGRSMAAAHKHLCITPAQWEVFMQDARDVLTELGVESGAKGDLLGILQSFQADCTVTAGEVAPADPGRPKPAAGSEGTLYYRLGGVYPIAQFVDRLVEAVLKGDRVKIDLDKVEDPQSKRHAAGLKYMVTELICNCTGGPEIVTSKGFDDAKLGVPAEQWPTFLEVANEAAMLWPSQLLRTSVLNALAEQKAELCIDVFAEDDSAEAKAMREIQMAGFGHFEATAALEKCGGDPSKALDLLMTGWSAGLSGSLTSLSSISSAGGCPFSGAPASSSAGARCPFSGAPASSSQRCPFSAPAPPAPVVPELDERTADAARTLAEKGIPVSQIATLLSVDESAVSTVITSNGSGSRKLMGGSGKSLTAGYVRANAKSTVSAGNGDCLDKMALLSALCPLHWDKRTLKLASTVCAVSWFLLLLLLLLLLDHASIIMTMTMTMTVAMTLAISKVGGLGLRLGIRKC